ncbi:MAG: hypothetical protein M3159_09795 [Actinomycetota bacterium]|nr:hypothetical protein [Actinomycetota bacterium]
MDPLEVAGYVLAALTVILVAATLGAPVVRQRLVVLRLRRGPQGSLAERVR